MESINGNGESRLDRIECLLEASQALYDAQWERNRLEHEDFAREHKQLLIAQVVMADPAAKLDLKMAEFTDKLNGLIGVIDGQIRDRGTR